MNPECVTCALLGRCDETTPLRILQHYRCNDWEEVARPEEVQARCEVINKFGNCGLLVLINSPEEPQEESEEETT